MSSDLFSSMYNPDVLVCLANLSSDEVFTPPEIANKMLDMLPEEIWHDSSATFLDPACKSGVFLREIAKRLIDGLEDKFPDLQQRIDHIFHKQIYGIAITELTSLVSRRSVYCSKYANSPYSITQFDDISGNVRFKKIKHRWQNGKCIFCGASEGEYERDEALETHAYEWIHTVKPKEIFGMKFDVIIGNPPYQLSDGGAQKSASPLYQEFIRQAKRLNPRYLSMIVPARWYSGGKGLDTFREEMLHDEQIAIIHDFPETSDCFPGVNIRGGVCYFLWQRGHIGHCEITNHKNGQVLDKCTRALLEKDATTFIRYNKAISILHKVQKHGEPSMAQLVSARKPFGLATNFNSFSAQPTPEKSVQLYRFGDNGFVAKKFIEKNADWIHRWKVFEPYASPGADDYPHLILSKPIVAGPNTVCTETYLVVGPFDDQDTAQNVSEYMKTRFFRFMLMLMKSTQHITQKVYSLVPMQDFSKSWTDKELYTKYGLTDDEINFIESMIKPME